MIERIIRVTASLEARPAALFVQAASNYGSEIYVQLDDKKVNAKSIMGMISIGILEGQTITLTAHGNDAQAAVDELGEFFNSAR